MNPFKLKASDKRAATGLRVRFVGKTSGITPTEKRPDGPGVVQWGALASVLFLLASTVVAQGGNDAFMFEDPPRRLALVAGNSDYENADPLPGSVVDATETGKLLESLGFDVTPVLNFKTRADFLQIHFLPFLDKIEEGDFVVLYFSGHGFSFAGDSYITPLKFPKTVPESKVFKTFMAEPSLRDMILARNPAFLLVVLDACRNIGGLVVKDPRGRPQGVAKGLAGLISTPSNVMIAYSTAPGEISIGSATKELSHFTAGLVKHLGEADLELDDARRKISIFVRKKTRHQATIQKPWFSLQSDLYVWFNPADQTHAVEREAWEGALEDGNRDAVETFLMLYGVSPYATAARKWLTELGDLGPRSITRVAAAAPEIAWDLARSEPEDRSMLITSLVAPLALTRTAASFPAEKSEDTPISGSDLARLVTVSGEVPLAQTSLLSAEILAAHGDAVAMTPLSVRAAPDTDARILTTIPYWQRVQVLGSATGTDGRTWSSVALSDQRRIGFVRMPETGERRTIEIGKPLQEVYLGPRSEDAPTLANKAQISEAIQEIRDSGVGVQWISIATAQTDDERLNAVLRARASNAVLNATRSGVPRGRITTVVGTDLKEPGVRMRIFGG